MKRIIFTLAILSGLPAPAETTSIIENSEDTLPSIFLKALDADEIQFKSFIEQSSNATSFTNYFLNSRRTSSKANKVNALFEDGTKYYLANVKNMARLLYKEIYDMAFDEDWSDHQRQMVQTAIDRLTELDPDNKSQYLKFQSNYKAENLKNQSSSSWNLSESKFDFVLINGMEVDLSQTNRINLPKGTFRITFISNTYKPQTFIVDRSQLELLTPTTIPFIDGDCKNPMFNFDESLGTHAILFFSSTCMLKKTTSKWIGLNENAKSLPVATQVQTNFTPQEAIYKKTWFKVTAGILLGGVLIYSVKKAMDASEKNPEPPVTFVNF